MSAPGEWYTAYDKSPCGGCGNFICSCPAFKPYPWPKSLEPWKGLNPGQIAPSVKEILDQLNVKKETPIDNVNKPAHYNHNWKEIECIDAIEASMTPVEFLGYLKGNIMKYTWRYSYKNGLEDLEKASWYYTKMIQSYKEYTDKKLIIVTKKGLQNA